MGNAQRQHVRILVSVAHLRRGAVAALLYQLIPGTSLSGADVCPFVVGCGLHRTPFLRATGHLTGRPVRC